MEGTSVSNDPLIEEDDASTPLTEEREELIPSYITLRSELNEGEQRNILEAEEWAFSRDRDVLSEHFLKELHRKMFGKVWQWAGKFRQSERVFLTGSSSFTLFPMAMVAILVPLQICCWSN